MVVVVAGTYLQHKCHFSIENHTFQGCFLHSFCISIDSSGGNDIYIAICSNVAGRDRCNVETHVSLGKVWWSVTKQRQVFQPKKPNQLPTQGFQQIVPVGWTHSRHCPRTQRTARQSLTAVGLGCIRKDENRPCRALSRTRVCWSQRYA